MALEKLPNDIQHLISASTQINSYKRAIEELVYNSLDASSTSIAIRIHIEEDTIQVVDNGHGITKRNFGPLGQKYMTSKYVDMNTLKSVPNKYGFRGESLANIIKLSQNVKIISRHESGEETHIKYFCNGKEQITKELMTRPSKGTTVEVKGFLYNLSIQKKATDSMNIIQDIKTFLEQLSLVHSHISLSLRDDSKNEIVFKMHKKRDIYQTLSSLFGIDKSDFQELKVEKQQYKVIGFIGNSDKEIGRNWVFLNGKFIINSKLHKIINDIMAKSINRDQGNRRAAKIKKTHKDYPDLFLFKNKIPFYFIFVTCPYNDYDVSYTPKKSVLEFKDWEQIKKLLEKLIKFYTGDIHLKEIKKSDTKVVTKEQEGTRLEVRKIMERILGGNSKKLGVSQMQKGIKGKRIKRNSKKKHVYKTLNSVVPPENTKSDDASNAIELNAIETHLQSNNNNLKTKKKTKSVQETIPNKTIECFYQHNTHINKEGSQQSNYKNKEKIRYKNISKVSKQCRTAIAEKEKLNNQNNSNGRTSVKKIKPKKDPLYERFENPTESLKMRWDILAKKAENILERRKKRVTEMIAKQTETQGNKLNNNKIDTAHNNVRNIYNFDYTPVPPMFNRHNTENHVLKKKQERPYYKTTYDLVHTILKSQQERNPYFELTFNPIKKVKTINKIPNTNNSNIQHVSKLTFESHNYYNINRNHDNTAQKFNKLSHKHFMTKESRDNFKLLTNKCNEMYNPYNRYLNTKKTVNKRTMIFKIGNSIKDNRYEETSYTIEFSEKNNHEKNDDSNLEPISHHHDNNQNHSSNNFDTLCYEANCNTYTVLSSAFLPNSVHVESNPLNLNMHVHRNTYIMSNSDNTLNIDKGNRNSKKFDNVFIETNNESMFMFSSNLQRRNSEVMFGTTIEPINICETILSNDITKILQNNNEPLNMDNNDLIDNIFTHIEECVEKPNFNEGEIMNHDDEQNNYYINEDLNINACKEKSDYTRDNQALEIESNGKGIEDPNNDTNFDKREMIINHINEPNKGVNNESINLNICEEKSFYTKDGEDTDIERTRQKVSHHFDIITNSNNLTSRQSNIDKRTLSPILTSTINKNLKENRFNQNSNRLKVLQDMKQNKQQNKNTKFFNEDQNEPVNLIDSNTIEKDMNNFILKTRLHFVPKGMSPIFANCNNKDICDYNLEKDYYEDNIYNNFANDVQEHSEVFKPRIENMTCVNNKDIDKVNNKLNKDNASLIFNGQSLKEAKVLGQVDGKFIAAILKGKCNVQDEISEFLILFDQHAVHERIRLENSLSDYIHNDKWKSIALDDISLTISKDDVLYLHNYMEKFDIFGLQWTFLSNCEISINTIPKAILGKNPRPVDKIIKAVKNLISEEINMIKLQKGCVSLYPKSIIDLVFSEACRYAIKFGDKLSNNDCMELLNALSKCKTPFQCAHGRPVMAVLMDYTSENHKYEVKSEKLEFFYRRNKK